MGPLDPVANRRRWVGPLRHYTPVIVALAVFAVVVVAAPSRPAPVVAPAAAGAGTPVYPPGEAPGDPGVAVSGVHCGPGVRQVPWSAYAPLCQPAFAGDNGGATAPGVTKDTITVTFRFAVTPAELQLASTLLGGVLGTEQQAIQLMDDYIGLFNRSYELWGRHVVLKVFQGQGDVLAESQGQDQAQAVADAAHAKSLGAFADVSGTIFNTPPYDNALAEDQVISVGGLFPSATSMRQHAPYEYAPGPDCQKAAEASAAIIGRSMAHLPAIYAGDPAMHDRTRVFGLLAPDVPIYQACAGATTAVLENRYHVHIQTTVSYGLSLTGQQEAANAIAQFKAAGVTTVLCGCDPLSPIYLTQAADAQHYRPEWVTLGFAEAFSRLPAQDQWAHAVAGGLPTVPSRRQEAVTAYNLVDHRPIPPSYNGIYEPLLLLFDALQAAGPDLTPQSFQAGFDSLPTSLPGGQYGRWEFGPGTVDPQADFTMQWWDPTAPSPQDGIAGTWRPCNGGATYRYSGQGASLPVGKQLACFGAS